MHNQINAFKDFCDARRLPLMAAVPLATGDVLDSAHLAHPDMPPVQAALHWNVTQGVAVRVRVRFRVRVRVRVRVSKP